MLIMHVDHLRLVSHENVGVIAKTYGSLCKSITV